MDQWNFPERGVVFWPVGNGDAITVVVDPDHIVQVDISHYDKAEHEDDPRVPVVDRLIELLRKPGEKSKPVLPVLAITHHDADHCSGFAKLISQAQVSELWITLRSFIEKKNEGKLTDDGQAIYDEACRRRKAEVEADATGKRADAGSRLRVIGNADVLNDADWQGFPRDLLTNAGQVIETVNGEDISDRAEFFVHTPFRDDSQEGSRNSSSLGMQVTLKAGDCEQRFLLLGDLEHEQIDAFFDKSEERGNEDRLDWNVLLAPHHGSKNAVLKQEGDDWVDADAVEDFRNYRQNAAMVVVSSRSFDDIGDDDTDPPHEQAIEVYEDMVGTSSVHYTADFAQGSHSDPLVVTVTEDSCGETKTDRINRLRSVGQTTSASVRPGDARGGTGDQEYA